MQDHINVCVCTYKRTNLLGRLLEKLKNQVTDNLFTYDIIVVDNDYLHSAQDTVRKVIDESRVLIKYFIEPTQNIALARNKGISNANGTFIAFIDDDEIPNEKWLLNLYSAYKNNVCDGVLGPVFPYFEQEPPRWVRKVKSSKKIKKEKYLIWEEMSTGNALILRSRIVHLNQKFDERLGRIGSSDSAFFKNMIKNGCSFVWANDAYVYEIVPPERYSIKWLLRRSLRGGGTYSKLKFEELNLLCRIIYTGKYFIAVLVFLICLPFSVLFGRHIFVRYLMKLFSNIGKIGGIFNILVIEYKG